MDIYEIRQRLIDLHRGLKVLSDRDPRYSGVFNTVAEALSEHDHLVEDDEKFGKDETVP